MCGIAGVWRKRETIGGDDLADVAAMMQAVVHRGPDGHGEWHDGRVAFGHRRLSIIDLTDDASQPMLTPDGLGVLTYNGEVYNFRRLRAALEREGVIFRTASDTEVVLLALYHWGPEKAVPLFDGMFAFGYLDKRSGVLWLGRDRLGIKPISVMETEERILFGSEDKQLLACAGVRRSVDTREIMLRMAGQQRDNESSLFSGVERVAPGFLWRIDRAGIVKTRYWHVLDVLDAGRILQPGGSDAERARELERLIEESVALHCISDATLATACSGGVDSGLVTALAKRIRPNTHGYVVHPLLGHSEAEAAERTGRLVGADIRRVPVDRESFLRLWPRTIWHLESDGWHGSLMGVLALTDQCRADGVKVLLAGEGADELFGGYPWQVNSMKAWRSLIWPASWFQSRRYVARRRAMQRLAPFAKSGGRGGGRNAAMRSLDPAVGLLQTELFDALEPVEPLTDRAFLGACLSDMYSHMQDLLHRHDRLSMASSVELRVPFIENALIDFAIHLPRRQKLRRGTGKWLLKQVAQKYLPRENIRAPKIGFGMSHDFSDGSEDLLRDGLLRDRLRWDRKSTDGIVEMAKTDNVSRCRLVGTEIFLRLYQRGDAQEEVGERLVGAVPKSARQG